MIADVKCISVSACDFVIFMSASIKFAFTRLRRVSRLLQTALSLVGLLSFRIFKACCNGLIKPVLMLFGMAILLIASIRFWTASAGVSIFQLKLAGVESTFPAKSTALTLKVWIPDAKLVKVVVGDAQLVEENAKSSKLH